MAQTFMFNSIYEDEMWVVKYENAEGYQEKFLKLVQDEIEKSNFPNIDLTVDEYKTGGIFFNKEFTKMLCLSVKNSQLNQFRIYYRAQVFGNVVVYTRMECIAPGFFTSGLSGEARHANIRSKCKNMAQYEEFVALDNLANIIFDSVLMKIDPAFKERKSLSRK